MVKPETSSSTSVWPTVSVRITNGSPIRLAWIRASEPKRFDQVDVDGDAIGGAFGCDRHEFGTDAERDLGPTAFSSEGSACKARR